jgi:hypothetical protein
VQKNGRIFSESANLVAGAGPFGSHQDDSGGSLRAGLTSDYCSSHKNSSARPYGQALLFFVAGAETSLQSQLFVLYLKWH